MDLVRSLKSLLGRKTQRGQLGKSAVKWSQLCIEELESRDTPSLVASFNFNEGTGKILHDLSGNGNNGAITNASWTTAGKFGRALSFSGRSNSLVSIANSPSLQLTAGMTLEAWVKP